MSARLTFKGVQQHLLSDVFVDLPLRGKVLIIWLQRPKHTLMLVFLLSYEWSQRVCVITVVCDQ